MHESKLRMKTAWTFSVLILLISYIAVLMSCGDKGMNNGEDGCREVYDRDAHIMKRLCGPDSTGVVHAKYYDQNGVLIEEGDLEEAKKQGTWKYYSNVGELEKVGYFTSDECRWRIDFEQRDTTAVVFFSKAKIIAYFSYRNGAIDRLFLYPKFYRNDVFSDTLRESGDDSVRVIFPNHFNLGGGKVQWLGLKVTAQTCDPGLNEWHQIPLRAESNEIVATIPLEQLSDDCAYSYVNGMLFWKFGRSSSGSPFQLVIQDSE